jgi:hypothetical protein
MSAFDTLQFIIDEVNIHQHIRQRILVQQLDVRASQEVLNSTSANSSNNPESSRTMRHLARYSTAPR